MRAARFWEVLQCLGQNPESIEFEFNWAHNRDLDEWVEEDEWMLVFASMYGRFDAQWFESQTRSRQRHLTRITMELLSKQRGVNFYG